MEDKETLKNNKDNYRSSVLDEVMDWLETLVLYCFIALLVFTFIIRIVIVDGSSMLPTLKNGEKLIVSGLFYTPKQSDIIVFNNTNVSLNKVLVKRVIAVGGQKLRINFDESLVYVDGEPGVPLDEPYINNPTNYEEDFETVYENYARDEYGNITIPEGYVFVMGDNRQDSTDSRSAFVGLVPEDQIIGKLIFRLYPFKSFI